MSSVPAISVLVTAGAVFAGALAAAPAGPVTRLRPRRTDLRTGVPPGLRARLRRAGPPTGVPAALVADLVAAALEAGSPPAVAVAAVSEALAGVDDPSAVRWRQLAARLALAPGSGERGGSADGVEQALEEALRLAHDAGLAPAELVRRAGEDARRAEAARTAIALARLPVLLVLPVGLCLLPAAVLLGVVPVVADLLLGVGAGLR